MLLKPDKLLPRSALNMLLVEDEKPCRRALQKVLRRCGYAVNAVATAEEAIAILAQVHSTTCMIVDVDLPGMSGLDLVRKVHDANPDMRYMVVSAANRQMIELFCSGYDAEFFPKPLDIPGFLSALEQTH